MNKIFCVRHGQTDWNLRELFQGFSDIPLNDTGRAQARVAAEKLKDTKFDVIYCSPLCRAHETCEIILAGNKFGGEIILDDRIKECNFGSYEGLELGDFVKKHLSGWCNLKHETNIDGMEKVSEVLARVHNFLDEVKAKHKDKNILIACHGGVMRAIYFYFNEFPADGDLYKAYQANNAEVAKYDL